MQRYGAYKDSGVEWIGEIPEGWHTDILFRAARILGSGCTPSTDVESNYDGDIPWLQVCDLGKGRVASASKCISEWALSKHSVLSMYSAPFLAIAMYASIGSISFVQRDSCVNQAICAISAGQLELRYLYYALKCAGPSMLADGVGGTQKNISQQYLRKIKLPVPSFDEQQAIADYLDGKTAEIDSIISQTERSIELLREYRKSVISEAVTKGLDPDAPMKDSAVEWIGEIPARWEVKAVKYFCRLQTGHTPPSEMLEYYGGERNWFTPGDIQNCIADASSRRLTQKAFDDRQVPVYPPGSTLMVAIGATAGKVGFAPNESSSNQQITSFSPNGCFSKWLFYSLLNERERLFNLALFTTMPILNNDYLSKHQIAVPPLPEQQAIADYLDAKTAEIDSLIADKQRQVELLKEYRKSLISEAVTGKFKVPGLE